MHSCRALDSITYCGKLHMLLSHFAPSVTETLYGRDQSMLAKGSMLAKSFNPADVECLRGIHLPSSVGRALPLVPQALGPLMME